jgi:dipeptidyl aminopeptidase/acylaminoacyl peptidase
MAREDLVDALFANPMFVNAKLSPSGQHLATLTHYKGKRSLLVLNLETKALQGVTVARRQDIGSFNWIGKDHLVYHVSEDEIYTKGLFAYSVSQDRGWSFLTPKTSELIFRGFVDPMLHDENQLILTLSKREAAEPPDLYSVNIKTSRTKRLASNTGEIMSYVVTSDGRPSFAIEGRSGQIQVLQWQEGDGWADAHAFYDVFVPVGMLPGDRYLLSSVTNSEGYTGAHLVDLKTGKPHSKPRFYPGYDLVAEQASYPIIDNLNGHVMGVRFNHRKPDNFWFDSSLQGIEKKLEEAFPGHLFEFLGYNPEAGTIFFIASKDIMAPVILSLNLETGQPSLVYSQYPHVADLEFMTMRPISFSHDGAPFKIHGYLTLPEGEGPYPTVVLVHGGPSVRDEWGFNPAVQLLALSGYAVLQVNYRGSTGYGNAYRLDSLGEIADKSVEDVIAGARWLIRQGVADPERICVLGGSFGGYISLAAATRAPDLWTGSVGYAGVYDLNRLYKDDRRLGYNWVDDLFNDYDEDLYAALSPINHVSRIQCPVLLIHGKEDQRVRATHARKMARALKRNKKEVDTLLISWGVHGLPEENDRLKFYIRILDFLEEHMPAGR